VAQTRAVQEALSAMAREANAAPTPLDYLDAAMAQGGVWIFYLSRLAGHCAAWDEETQREVFEYIEPLVKEGGGTFERQFTFVVFLEGMGLEVTTEFVNLLGERCSAEASIVCANMTAPQIAKLFATIGDDLPVQTLAFVLEATTTAQEFDKAVADPAVLDNFVALASRVFAEVVGMTPSSDPSFLRFGARAMDVYVVVLTKMGQTCSVQRRAPFPIAPMVKLPATKAFPPKSFDFIFKLCFSEGELADFALRALEAWLAAFPVVERVLVGADFLPSIEAATVELESPGMLVSVLSHHFADLLDHFVNKAVHGSVWHFVAISQVFRPEFDRALETSELLKALWLSVSDEFDPEVSEWGKTMYSFSGQLILASLYAMLNPLKLRREEAFVFLASVTPFLSVCHMNGRTDHVQQICSLFLRVGESVHSNFSSLAVEHVAQVSAGLADAFGFCSEQLLAAFFDNPGSAAHFEVITPWFAALHFDSTNSIVSAESDIDFMRFSIASFVRAVLVLCERSSESGWSIWRSLCERNFVELFLCCISMARRSGDRKLARIGLTLLFRHDAQTTANAMLPFVGLDFFLSEQQRAASSTSVRDDESALTPFLIEAAIALIESAGADVDAADQDGRRPLHWAVRSCSIEAIAALMKAGADAWARDGSGQSPADLTTLPEVKAALPHFS
jgi:hypothetical protein